MANGLDKLERLFSTKKKSAPSRNTADSNIYGNAPSSPSHAQAQQAQAQESPHTSTFSSQVPPRLPLQLQLADSPPLSFPPTPFIRPKANARTMQPRNELRLSNPQSVARTDSTSSSSRRLSRTLSVGSGNKLHSNKDKMTSDHQRRQSTYSTTASFHAPGLTSSLLSRRHDRNSVGPGQLQLSGDTPLTLDDSSQPASRPESVMSPQLKISAQFPPKRLLEALPIYPSTSRVETPPPSDQDDFKLPSPPAKRGQNHPTPMMRQLTPESSPDIFPQRDSSLPPPKLSSESTRFPPPSAPHSRRITASSVPLLDDDWRDSYVREPESQSEPETPEAVSPDYKVVFYEPPVEDFLALTDDDLAEAKTSYPSKPPAKRAPPPPILPPSARTATIALTIRSPAPTTPVLAHKEVAAWEAARIAKKFDFDVVYVANFWPTDMNFLHSPHRLPTQSNSAPNSFNFSTTLPPSSLSSPTSPMSTRAISRPSTRNATPRNSLPPPPADIFAARPPFPTADCCPNSGQPPSPNSPLSASLLAAYGLETIRAPFRLGAAVHRKILRTEGWIEHRNTDAAPHEFARGYARAFHRGWSGTVGGACGRRRSCGDGGQQVNRGIVFVAYRRPRGPDGAVNSSAAELDALEKEAETLVELILDLHLERRRLETAQGVRRASE